MLDDREQRILADLERGLVADDPDLAARMAGVADRPFPTIAALCALLFIAFPLVMLLYGWPGMGATLGTFAVTVAAVLIRRRTRRR